MRRSARLLGALVLTMALLLPVAAMAGTGPAPGWREWTTHLGLGVAARRVIQQVAPFPPAEQDLPPIVLRKHGVFWAGGEIVKRTQQGTQSIAGSMVPYTDQEYLVGQAYVEYFIPQNLRNGAATIPIVMIPGGGLVGVHYLTTPDGREGWADYFIRRGFPVYIVDPPGRGRAGFMVDPFNDVRAGALPPSAQPPITATDSAAWLEWNTGPEPRVHGLYDPTCIGNDNRGDPPVYCTGNRMPATDEATYKHWLGALMPAGPTPGGVEPGIAAVMEMVGPARCLAQQGPANAAGPLLLGRAPRCQLRFGKRRPRDEIAEKVGQWVIRNCAQPGVDRCLGELRGIGDQGGQQHRVDIARLPKLER